MDSVEFYGFHTQKRGCVIHWISQGSSSRKDYFSRAMCNYNTCSTCDVAQEIYSGYRQDRLNSFFCPRQGWDVLSSSTMSVTYLKYKICLYDALGVTEPHPACRGYGLWLSHTRVSMVAIDLGLWLTSQSDGTWWNMGRINVTITVVIVMIDSRVNIRKFSQMIPPPSPP